jgi:hypothetical protein
VPVVVAAGLSVIHSPRPTNETTPCRMCRVCAVRQDGMEAIKRLDPKGALGAFETALRMDNEVRRVGLRG